MVKMLSRLGASATTIAKAKKDIETNNVERRGRRFMKMLVELVS